MLSPQVRKYRTMTELIVDAIEFVKNPYKGKKLKVSWSWTGPVEPAPGPGSSCWVLTPPLDVPLRPTQTSQRSL